MITTRRTWFRDDYEPDPPPAYKGPARDLTGPKDRNGNLPELPPIDHSQLPR